MTELPLGINIFNIGINIGLFAVLYVVIAKLLLPSLNKAIEERQKKLLQIEKDAEKTAEKLAAAEKVTKQAEEIIAQAIVEGRKQAKIETDKLLDQARIEARNIVSKAQEKAEEVISNANSDKKMLVQQQVELALRKYWNQDAGQLQKAALEKIISEL